jgi:hypothetical protein
MTTAHRYQRRNTQHAGPGVSLFPFLAVLICTMGALVPLLLAITRTASLQAQAAAVARLVRQKTEVQTQREDVRWRVEQLKQSRAATESQLADARLQLGHIEDHSRRLREQFAQYEKTAAEVERIENADGQRVAQSQAELEQVRTQLKTAQQQLAQAHQAAAGRSRSYAVVPYEGPNQTRRRPVYLECREDAVVLQPEGIAFRESDFDGPLGPGNPLAAALRATREYMLAQCDFDPQAGEPYPLLLVRPEGINAYYAARAAMKSWGFDFGYELVDDDWKLAYPPPDTRLAEGLRQVIASARASQSRLVAAAPRQYGSRPKAVYRASPNGGFIREGGAPDDDRGYAAVNPAGSVGRDAGDGRGTWGTGRRTTGEGTSNSAPALGGGSGNPYSAAVERPGTTVAGTGAGTTGGANVAAGAGTGPGGVDPAIGGVGTGAGGVTGGGYDAGIRGSGVAADSGPVLTGNGMNQGGGSGDQRPAGNVYGFAGGQSGAAVPGGSADATGHPLRANGGAGATGGMTNETAASNPYRSSSESPGAANPGASVGNSTSNQQGSRGGSSAVGRQPTERPEGYVIGQPPREQPAASQSPPRGQSTSNESSSAGVERGRIMRPGEWEPTPEPPPKQHDDKTDQEDDNRGGKHKKSLAEKRGAEWGLRDAARGSVGVTRPIRVECYADRLVVVSERGPANNKVIGLGPRTASSIDTLISAVWESMETWGMAGRGMYWRPVLQVSVAPDAEQRFAELSALLNGSGVMVEKK